MFGAGFKGVHAQPEGFPVALWTPSGVKNYIYI
jgi:hypothetical protein